MNKWKKIFLFVFTSLLLVISISAVSLYDNVKNSYTNLFEGIEYYYEDEFQYLTIDPCNASRRHIWTTWSYECRIRKKKINTEWINDSIFETAAV